MLEGRAGNPWELEPRRCPPLPAPPPAQPGRRLLAAPPGLPFPGPRLPPPSSFLKREDVSQIDFTVGNGIIKLVVSIFIIAIIK